MSKVEYSEEFMSRYLSQAKSKLIAVDFDDTITFPRPYPEKAPLNPKAKKYLDKLNKAGFTLVLWTSRLHGDYEEAYERCVGEFNMPYFKKDDMIHGATGKLLATFYIDDKSCINNKVNWRKIYKFLIKKYGKEIK